ncbi:MAG: TolC family protein [Kofleriaceae bacterium]
MLARNPDVAAAQEAFRAAVGEIDQATALEDPMLTYEIAPLSVASSDAAFGQRIQLSQQLPFPGKRRLKGDVAAAEAEAMRGDVEAVRLELAQMASGLFDDYYLVTRSLVINAHHQELVARVKKAAEAQYVVGRAAQQDPLQAEVELAQLESDHVSLEAELDLVVAQLNRLLHRAPQLKLPRPPATLPSYKASTETVAQLQDLAISKLPQRASSSARIRGGQAAIALAEKQFYPDFEVMASYDSMWDMREHQWMVGIGINLPFQRASRRAAVDQAEARVARARSEDDRLVDTIRTEVHRAHRRMLEAVRIVEIFEQRLVPASRDHVNAALAGFPSGQTGFLAVIGAERTQREVELKLEAARAELSRRHAALDRAVGRIPGLADGGVR